MMSQTWTCTRGRRAGIPGWRPGGRRTSTLGPRTGGPRKRTLVPVSAPPGVPPEVPTYAELRQRREQGAVIQRRLLSVATVKSHVNHLLPKIGARDRAQAVSYAYRRGITGA